MSNFAGWLYICCAASRRVFGSVEMAAETYIERTMRARKRLKISSVGQWPVGHRTLSDIKGKKLEAWQNLSDLFLAGVPYILKNGNMRCVWSMEMCNFCLFSSLYISCTLPFQGYWRCIFMICSVGSTTLWTKESVYNRGKVFVRSKLSSL